MKSTFQLSLPGYVFAILCCIPGIVFCCMNKNKLPEMCASHFNIHNVPDGFMKRDSLFWSTILTPPGMAAFFIIMGLMFYFIPLSAYNGIDTEYFKKNNRFNQLKSLLINMMSVLSAIISLFMFSILEPTWEYNLKCEINPTHPVPCEYKLHFLPQLIIFLIVFILVIAYFSLLLAKKNMKETLDPKEDDNWKCGMCYVNMDDERICVPKRMGVGVTINMGNTVGVMIIVILLLLPIITVALTYLML